MQWMRRIWPAVLCIAIASHIAAAAAAAAPKVALDPDAAPRVQYGAARLTSAMNGVAAAADRSIVVGTINSPSIQQLIRSDALKLAPNDLKSEGFCLSTLPDGRIVVAGDNDSGALYGCLELAQRLRQGMNLPADLHFIDAPVFKLRGPCIGMQKTYILPGRHVYEYPYTPELFPFFYDKQFWTEYLDFLATNRMNTLYLWSGHPFASLVKLADYPYAMEVPEDVFQKNVEMYRWITAEADRRGIWVVQMFYNIILSKPFAEHNGLATQLAASTPIVDDYMRKSIAEFVRQYPHVGLMLCLGEALQGIDNQKYFLTKVILPGVHDGMKQAGLTQEPPVVIRTHATDLRLFMADALRIYKNLYTEAKFNGESLTTWEPRGTRQQVHLAMSQLGSTHLINVHILANLEPFRYGDVNFIKRCVQAGRDRLGARGLHLYPLSYWNWPDSPDKVDPPLKQWERDWIWFEAWARYSWNPDIDDATDHAYWISRLSDMYGTKESAEHILAAYNESGECAPRILRRFGITEGNRQTLSLGMTLSELVHPEKFHEFPELWESQSPPGERLKEYVDREMQHQAHEGETPPQIVSEILKFSGDALAAINAAAPTRNEAEFGRLKDDINCIRLMSQFYAAKVNAAMAMLRYERGKNIGDLRACVSSLSESVDFYRQLSELTERTYRFANSMQTSQRRIPVPGGVDGKPANYHWTQVLPVYERELDEIKRQLSEAQSGQATPTDDAKIQPLPKATITLLDLRAQTYQVNIGAKVFTDRDDVIQSLAPELNGLTGIRLSYDQMANGLTPPIEFEVAEPVTILVGYIQSTQPTWLQPPNLETDATAIDRGDVEPLIQNAATIQHLPAINIYGMKFAAGKHKLEMHGRGSFIVLGVIRQSANVIKRDAHRPGGS